MIKRTFRGLLHLSAGLVAGLVVIVLLIAWQFSQGPIPLGFLSPYIEQAVNRGDRAITLRMGETILTWAGWERALDIRVLDVRLVDKDGATVGSIPEAAFSISGSALAKGELAPKSIDLFGPKLHLRRGADGHIAIGFGSRQPAAGGVGLGGVSSLLDAPLKDGPLRYLSRVAVIGGDITVTDQVLGKSWHMPAADLHLERYIDRLNGRLSLVLATGTRQTALEFAGDYMMASRRLHLDVRFDQVSPAMFAGVTADLAPLGAMEMPFSGRMSVGMPIDGRIDSLEIAATGGPGKLHLPAPLDQSLAVRGVELDAVFTGASAGTIRKLAVRLAPDGSLALPAPLDHRLPLRTVNLTGRFAEAGASWEIDSLEADLGGPKLAAKASRSKPIAQGAPADMEVTARLAAVPVDEVGRVWPKSLGADARAWVTAHISKGVVPSLDFAGRFRLAPGGELKVVSLDGTMSVKDTVVDYLAPLPAVNVAQATMSFDESSYTITIEKAGSQGLAVRGGTIAITGLNEFDQFADIDLRIEGSVAAQLAYINNEPLQFASALRIDPKNAGGRASTRLKLFFILEKTLGWDGVQVWARSKLTDVSMGSVFLGRGINEGRLDLRVDKRGMDVSGSANFDKIPTTFAWRENFTDKQAFRSRYKLSARIADIDHIRDLGLDMDPFSGNYIHGAVGARIEFTVLDDVDRRLEVVADITDARLSAPAFGWAKAKGTKGEARVVMNLARDLVVGIPDFAVKAADLTVQGAAKYALDGTGLERIDFKKIVYGRTDMQGALIPKSDGTWEAGFHGESFDLSPMWREILAKPGEPVAGGDRLLERLTLAVELKQVWLGPQTALRDVSGTFARDHETWRTVLLRSRVSETANFELDIQPGADGNRRLLMRSDNAGAIFKFLEVYPNMTGGRLLVSGVYDDAAPGQPLKGQITVTDYRVVNAPVLARLLSIMALTGILDALEGEGLAFRDLSIPFELDQGTFVLKDARASGTSLGFTANGKVFRHADVVDLEGTVIPAYALNSAFGKIPLLGDIFTGGEKGGGVFAATYTMTGPMEEPVVSVNPLSALAPGFLRNVFGTFGRAGQGATEPGADDKTPTVQ